MEILHARVVASDDLRESLSILVVLQRPRGLEPHDALHEGTRLAQAGHCVLDRLVGDPGLHEHQSRGVRHAVLDREGRHGPGEVLQLLDPLVLRVDHGAGLIQVPLHPVEPLLQPA